MMSKAVRCIALDKRSTLRTLLVSTKRGSKQPTCICNTRNYGNPSLLSSNHQCSVPIEHFDLMPIVNEKILQYEKGSEERKNVENALQDALNKVEHVPIVINGKKDYYKNRIIQTSPFNHKQTIATFRHASRMLIDQAIQRTMESQQRWDETKLTDRMKIWESGADLIANKYRYKIIAAIMLGQAKTLRQAELDVVELVDFMRINPIFLRGLANYEPLNNNRTHHNHMRFHGLPGFVAAISPFNYTSIAAHLAYTPALMGNAVLWKPSDSAILSNWYVFEAMCEAGLPSGVVNFVPAQANLFANAITESSGLAGINFIGTEEVLKELWQKVADNINYYENYPRLIGESGGKNFHFVHSSADVEAAVACTIRAAFEYAGQKCSACSMLYVPESLWEQRIKPPLLNIASKLFVSDATFCDCFYSAVINKRAYKRIFTYLKYIKNNDNCKLLIGGTGDKKRGYYIDPTIVEIKDLDDQLCRKELLAPILCVHVYKDNEVEQVMAKVAEINHGLTGSVFATDGTFIKKACAAFKLNVGNLNINDKSTGSVVGQQPFGAGHLTGTSDKMGSPHYLLRWTSPQSIKESFVPHKNIYYPYMEISEQVQNMNKSSFGDEQTAPLVEK